MALTLAAFLLAVLRIYIGFALVVSVVAVFGIVGIRAIFKKKPWLFMKMVGFVAVILIPTLIGGDNILPKMMDGSHHDLAGMITQRGPEYLGLIREGILRQKGESNLDPNVHIRTLGEMFQYVPRSLTLVFLSPVPWEWSKSMGKRGLFQSMVHLEVVLICLLLLVFFLSVKRFLYWRDAGGWLLFVFMIFLAALLGIAVPNIGTLFRIRMPVIIVLIILVATLRGLRPIGRNSVSLSMEI